MKLDKGAILASMAIIMVASLLAGAGTMAYFSDTGKSTGNVFTANNDFGIMLSDNEGASWHDDVSGSWTFDNMIPGDTYNAYLWVKNTGTPSVQCLLLDMDVTGDTGELDDYFNVIAFYVYDSDGTYAGASGKGTFSNPIRRYCDGNNLDPASNDDFISFAQDQSGMFLGGLESGDWLKIWYQFEFEDTEESQNEVMGDSLTLKYTLEARSSPCPA